jgi:hypothetical protein
VQAQNAREGPREIEKCQTISQPGSYKLVNNLTFTGTTGVCLSITADFVTIDLAGFTISGPGPSLLNRATAIAADRAGITVRNGSISGFFVGVELLRLAAGEAAAGSIVEGLRVGEPCPCSLGISATGIVKGNTVETAVPAGEQGIGISATGIVTGNFVIGGSRTTEYEIGQGSTVIGNTAVGVGAAFAGISVSCPSNVTDNTAVNNFRNLTLIGEGCNNTNNVAP